MSWFPDLQPAGAYAFLRKLSNVRLWAKGNGDVARDGECKAEIALMNSSDVMAFFVRLRVLKSVSGERVLPVFYDDNYVTILPGETVKIAVRCRVDPRRPAPVVTAQGWNTSLSSHDAVVPIKWTRA
ncbi:MAG TPA: glycoside hydrolase family 2 protein [Terrimicrobiaceae bacterium]